MVLHVIYVMILHSFFVFFKYHITYFYYFITDLSRHMLFTHPYPLSSPVLRRVCLAKHNITLPSYITMYSVDDALCISPLLTIVVFFAVFQSTPSVLNDPIPFTLTLPIFFSNRLTIYHSK